MLPEDSSDFEIRSAYKYECGTYFHHFTKENFRIRCVNPVPLKIVNYDAYEAGSERPLYDEHEIRGIIEVMLNELNHKLMDLFEYAVNLGEQLQQEHELDIIYERHNDLFVNVKIGESYHICLTLEYDMDTFKMKWHPNYFIKVQIRHKGRKRVLDHMCDRAWAVKFERVRCTNALLLIKETIFLKAGF